MDPRMLEFYNQELQHIREMGGEFARDFPKIAGRLGLDGFECADPYVERLLEGFAFLAARVQLKMDAEFPRFTQHLLELIYPDYLAPTPSMVVVQLQPDLTEGALGDGFLVPRSSVLRSILGKGDQTPCEYRTAHDLKLWPLELRDAEYYTRRDLPGLDLPDLPSALGDVQAALRIRIRTTAGLKFEETALDALPLYLRGADEMPMHLYEQLLGNSVGIAIRPPKKPAPWKVLVDADQIRPRGFADDDALLPVGDRSFQGYRLLSEYFTFPDRFLFVELGGLKEAVRRAEGNELDLVVLLDRADSFLENAVQTDHFALFCTPAINLFPKRADRVHLKEQQTEFHVIPDRTRPLDFEVHSIREVVGHGTSAEQEQEFRPFYGCDDLRGSREESAYYTVQRRPRRRSTKQRRGPRSSYFGGEVFVSLVDSGQAPYSTDLRQLAVKVFSTNRDLPLLMSLGQGRTDFTMESGAPVESIRCVAGPSRPYPSYAVGETAWRLISHLSLNYLSLLNRGEDGASALRELLALYGNTSQPEIRKQIDGLKTVSCASVMRRVSRRGPIAFGRGVEIAVTFDELSFEGSGVFLLGAVLEQFFARYASINSFTETVIRTVDRGEVIRWPLRTGRRHIL